MKSGKTLFFTILYWAIFAQTFAKFLNSKSLNSNETDVSNPSTSEHPPPTEPLPPTKPLPPTEPLDLDFYEPETPEFSTVSFITAITASRHFNICPGTIIGRRYVVTAADCVTKYRAENIFVKDIINGAYVTVKNIIFSEIYSEKDQLAVLELEKPLNIQAEPISLISKDQLEKAIEAHMNVSAVGYQNNQGPLIAKLKLYPEKECIENYRQMLTEADKYDFNETLHFCFFPMKGGFVSKFNGGSLIINGKLAGIKIHNNPYTNNSLYTKINHFEEFLNQFIDEEETTTTTSTPEPGIADQCPELSEMLKKFEQLFQTLFWKVFETLNKRINDLGLSTNLTSEKIWQPRVSRRNGDFQSASESVLEFQLAMYPQESGGYFKQLKIEHTSRPYFYFQATDERLYFKIVKDEYLIDPNFWFSRVNVNIEYLSYNDELIEQNVDLSPLHLLNFITTLSYLSSFNFFPSFTNSVYNSLVDTLHANLNIYLNLIL